MEEHIRQNEFMEQDRITLSLKKRAACLLADAHQQDGRQDGRMRWTQRKDYVHTVRALEAHLAERERHTGGVDDPYRSIYDFFLQEIGSWYGESNPGPEKKLGEF
jgi:hypothetical protein